MMEMSFGKKKKKSHYLVGYGGFILVPNGNKSLFCERFEPRSHFKSRLSLIVRMNVVLNRTVVDSDCTRFDNLCGSHLQSQSELYHVS